MIFSRSQRGTMPSATAELSVDMDRAKALREMADALLVLDEDGEVTLDANSNHAWLDTPPSWNSVGKRVTAEFDGHVIHVTSQSRRPFAKNLGQNQANVDAVIAVLERVHGRAT